MELKVYYSNDTVKTYPLTGKKIITYHFYENELTRLQIEDHLYSKELLNTYNDYKALKNNSDIDHIELIISTNSKLVMPKFKSLNYTIGYRVNISEYLLFECEAVSES